MQEEQGNLWDGSIIVITTNGFVKKNGECVMGRGCARQAANRYASLPSRLGQAILKYGNRVMDMGEQHDGIRLLTFPVKPITVKYNGSNVVAHMKSKFRLGEEVPGWAAIADLRIIEDSARNLAHYANSVGLGPTIRMPRPGCGAGELRWEDVKPVLDKYLDDRFVAVTY